MGAHIETLDRKKDRFLNRLGIAPLRNHYALTLGETKRIAGRLGVDPRTVSRWLNGSSEISIERAQELDLVRGGSESSQELFLLHVLIEKRLKEFCAEADLVLGSYWKANRLPNTPLGLIESYLDNFGQALDDTSGRADTPQSARIVLKRMVLLQISMRWIFAGPKSEYRPILHRDLIPLYVRYPTNIIQVDPIKTYIQCTSSHKLSDLIFSMLEMQARAILAEQGPAPLFDHAIQLLNRFGWKGAARDIARSVIRYPNVLRSSLIGRSNEIKEFNEAEEIISEFERRPDAKAMIPVFESVYFGTSSLDRDRYPASPDIYPSVLETISRRYNRVFDTADSVVGLYKFMTVAEAMPVARLHEASGTINRIFARLETERDTLALFEKKAIARFLAWRRDGLIRSQA